MNAISYALAVTCALSTPVFAKDPDCGGPNGWPAAMVFVAIVMLTVVGGIAYLAVILAERRVLHYLPARGYQGF